jgi:hypothetical protein
VAIKLSMKSLTWITGVDCQSMVQVGGVGVDVDTSHRLGPVVISGGCVIADGLIGGSVSANGSR